MAKGAYVAAWVWVEAPEDGSELTAAQWRAKARFIYQDEGVIEIDDNATISEADVDEEA